MKSQSVRGVVARVALGLVGLALLAWIVAHVGLDAVAEVLRGALPWMPAALVLEGARISCDALASGLVLGPAWRKLGASRLLLAHVAGHGVMNVMPGGRSASEVVKAALFFGQIGASEAAALGTTNQANVLVASALFSVPCAAAAWVVTPNRTLPLAIAVHAFVLFFSGFGLRLLASSPHVEHFVKARAPRWERRLADFHASSRGTPLVAWGPVLAMALGRAVQTLQYALLAIAVGLHVDVLVALTVQGTNLVAAALGVLVPGQIGSSEGVFMLAAEALGTSPARATSVALLAHVSGLTWTAAGLLVLLFWRPPRPTDEELAR